jgi:hypothetical protein
MKKKIFLRRTKKIFLISLFTISIFLCFRAPLFAKEERYVFSVIKIEGVRNDLLGHLKEGESVIESATKKELGRVYEIKTEPAFEEIFSQSEKKLVLSRREGYSDLYLTLYAKGELDGGEFLQNGYPLKIGKKISLRLPSFCGVGHCVSISETEGAK